VLTLNGGMYPVCGMGVVLFQSAKIRKFDDMAKYFSLCGKETVLMLLPTGKNALQEAFVNVL
jgi:hypothetical protein